MWSLSSAIMHDCSNVWSCLPLEHIKGPGHQILLFLKPAGHIPAVGPLLCLFAVLNTLPSVPTGLSFCHSLNCVPHCLWMWPCLEIVFADIMTRSSWISCCSVTQSCPTLCNPMNCSTPGFPVLHYLPEFVQTHVHWVRDAIQPSHPLSPPSPSLNLSQHQGLFQMSQLFESGVQSVGTSASASVLPVNIQDWFPLGRTGLISLQSRGLSRVFSSTSFLC